MGFGFRKQPPSLSEVACRDPNVAPSGLGFPLSGCEVAKAANKAIVASLTCSVNGTCSCWATASRLAFGVN